MATKTKTEPKLKPVKEPAAPRAKAVPSAKLLGNKTVVELLGLKSKLVESKRGGRAYPDGYKYDKEKDGRTLPRDGHLTGVKAFEAREGNRAGGLLKPDSDNFDFENFQTVQTAIAGSKDPEALVGYLANLGIKIDLDEASTCGNAERNKPSDIQYLKEVAYTVGTLSHLAQVVQPTEPSMYGSLEIMQKRLETVKYSRVKRWDEQGKPAEGAGVPRSTTPPKVKAETVLGCRKDSAIGKAAVKLFEAGKKGLTVREFEEASGLPQRNTIARLVEQGHIRLEEAASKKRADAKLYAVA